uniref:Uncharacterized protein n=1 Tax=Aegilops tauschii subsp. strangulata TaxID=200361 RepID=A0A453BJK8_AEGTS
MTACASFPYYTDDSESPSLNTFTQLSTMSITTSVFFR